MKSTCEEARSWVPRALMNDLAPADQQALDAHLADCTACACEQRLYIDTLSQVRSVSDVPVPRHFFVYPEERRFSVMQFLRGLTPGWKLAASFAAMTLAIVAILGAARVQFRAEQGVYSFSFGRPLPIMAPAKDSAAQAAQIEALRVELRGLLEARSRTERAEWMKALQQEIDESNRSSDRQRQQWNAALANLESRLNGRLDESAVVLRAGLQQSTNDVFRALQRQRQQDLALTSTRLERLATQGELKDQETDEILATLLQVARLPEQ